MGENVCLDEPLIGHPDGPCWDHPCGLGAATVGCVRGAFLAPLSRSSIPSAPVRPPGPGGRPLRRGMPSMACRIPFFTVCSCSPHVSPSP
jgi:hypothetical protein